MSRAIILRGPHRHQTDRQPRGLDWSPSPAAGRWKLHVGQSGRGVFHRLSRIKQLRRVKMTLEGGPSSEVGIGPKSPSCQLTHHPGPALPFTPSKLATEHGLDQGRTSPALLSPLQCSQTALALPLSLALALAFSCPYSPLNLSPPSHPHCPTPPLPKLCRGLMTPLPASVLHSTPFRRRRMITTIANLY